MKMRPPEQVMRLSRMGAAHPTRLSFMRVLLRTLRREGWTFDRPVWDINDAGVGRAVYRAVGPRNSYSLVAFAHDLPADKRSDRVIAEAWDATFTLFDGTPTPTDIDRLEANVPLQEAGRISDSELVLSRANRSVRLWDHVVSQLAQGQQPDPDQIAPVGYLMRTTAVYGSGKFGAADHETLRDRSLMAGPFRAEMLSVWLIRAFALDLVEHLAQVAGGNTAARLDPHLRRQFGIGNSTGLGMAPFLVNHPNLLNAWINARETALARVRALPSATADEQAIFLSHLRRATAHIATWTSSHDRQRDRLIDLTKDCKKLETYLAKGALARGTPWDALITWSEANLSIEGQEMVTALALEPYGDSVDELAHTMGSDTGACPPINGRQTVDDLCAMLTKQWAWAEHPNYATKPDTARFWYVSEAKLEPRLGDRHEEPGGDLELPLDVARRVQSMARDIAGQDGTQSIADFLQAHPQHRRAVRRVQQLANAPYAEIRDNLLAHTMMPIDMLRCKLSFFGATRFDPRSDRWVRVTMFQNAPFPHELQDMPVDDWAYPSLTPAA